jgi:hypothetical protein
MSDFRDPDVLTTITVAPSSPYATGEAKYVFGRANVPWEPYGRGDLIGKVVKVLDHPHGMKVLMIEKPTAGGPYVPLPRVKGLRYPWD